MNKQLFEKIPGDQKPKKKGEYITNFGILKFDGSTFLMGGHKQPTPIVVEYYMVEYTGAAPALNTKPAPIEAGKTIALG